MKTTPHTTSQADLKFIADMRWTAEILDAVDDEIEALPPKLQARLLRLLEMIENVGLEQIHEPHVKHLGRVDKRGSPGAVIVIQAGICNGDQRGTRPDVERRVGVL